MDKKAEEAFYKDAIESIKTTYNIEKPYYDNKNNEITNALEEYKKINDDKNNEITNALEEYKKINDDKNNEIINKLDSIKYWVFCINDNSHKFYCNMLKCFLSVEISILVIFIAILMAILNI